MANPPSSVDRGLERQGRRLGRPAGRMLGIALACLICGVALWVLAGGAAEVIGIVLTAIGVVLATIGGGLLAAGAVAKWSAHRRPFA